jgi:TRAP-type mannitol/chloroaromatic compound transport system substrate-binding protein
MTSRRTSRRAFLKATAAGGAAASALPAPAIAQGRVRWRMVTCWPRNFPGVGIAAQRIADRIGEMSDGRLEVKLFAAGEFVPAFEVFDAVRDGNAECGHDSPYYWIAKNRSAAFFSSVPGGLTPDEHMGWVYYGGGQQLWDELYGGFGLRAWLAGNAGMQMVGWFRREVHTLDDMKGLKIRMAGLQAEVLNRMGATTVNLPGGEIMPALQSGVIDAAEWGGPWMDLAFGFYKVAKHCYGPGVHEPGTAQSLMVNLAAYEALPKDLQAIVRNAATVEAALLLSEFNFENAVALQTLIKDHDVTIGPLPAEVLKRWFEISADVVAETAADGDINKRIYDSWSTYRKNAVAIAPLSVLGYMQSRGASA